MANQGKLSRRSKALLAVLAAAFIIGIFIYLEQIAILYVVATLAIVLLLLIVAFADLESVGREKLDSN
jgi:hypothetical protein